MGIAEPSLIQDLQQQIHNLRMRLFDLIKQHHRIGAAAHLFGQLACLIVSHIAGGRTDHFRNRMLLHVFGHIQPDQCFRGVEHLLRQHLDQLCFAHAGRAHKDKGCRAATLGKLHPGTLDGTAQHTDRLGLPDDPLGQILLQMLQLGKLRLSDLAGRHACPDLHHLGEILLRHCDIGSLLLQLFPLLPQTDQIRLYLRQSLIIRRFRLLDLLFLCFLVGNALDGFVQLTQLRMPDGCTGTAFIQQVDGLVRQEPVIDIPVGKHRTHPHQIFADLHPVECFVILLDAHQHCNRIINGRHVHCHRLEPALQGAVLFNILPVFAEGGGTDDLDFSPGQGRLENIRRIHRAFGITRANQVVYLIDKQDDIPLFLNLADEALHPAFKLTPELGASHQGGQIHQIDPLATQIEGHLSGSNLLGDALRNGGLAHTRLTDQAGIVFLSPGQDLDHPCNFPFSCLPLPAGSDWCSNCPGTSVPCPFPSFSCP